MIQVLCPKCQKLLLLPPLLAGSVGQCPDCGQKFRIPAASAPPHKPPDKPAGRGSPPTLSVDEEEYDYEVTAEDTEEEEQDFEVVADDAGEEERPRRKGASGKSRKARKKEEQEGSPSKRQRVVYTEDELVDRNKVDVRKRPRRRRPRQRERGPLFSLPSELIPGMDNFISLLILIGTLWVLMGVVGLLIPVAGMAPLLLGIALMIGGRIWFVVMAFQDDPAAGLLCLLIPIYQIIYLLNNQDTVGRAFLLEICGLVMAGSGAVLLGRLGG